MHNVRFVELIDGLFWVPQNEINTYGFETPKKVACRHLYRCCVEHHAFFRLVQTPMVPKGNGADIYGGGIASRFHSLPHPRIPPTFNRLPSNRQLRRSFHESSNYHSNNNNHTAHGNLYNKRELHRISIPQNLHSADDNNNNNSTANNASQERSGSPQSSKSVPRSRSQQRGLFGVAQSPRSVRSASRSDLSQVRGSQQFQRHRSSSVESQSSNDSRSGRRYRSGRHRRASDNESELSRGSGKSGHSHNSHRKQRRHRSKKRRNESGSENESTKIRNYSGHRSSSKGNYELVDSELQWQEVQRKQSEIKDVLTNGGGVQQAAVTKSSNLTNTGTFGHRNRKHRSRHRSPGNEGGGGGGGGNRNSTSIWNSELAKHLQFDLIDTAGMSEDQLREIPYTIVETNTPAKLSSHSLKVHKNGALPGHRMDRVRP